MKESKFFLLRWSLLWRKPLFVMRSVFKYAANRLSKRGSFTSVSFAATYDCNFKCSHCYATKFRQTARKPLSLDEKVAAIKESLRLGAIAVDFVGGEVGNLKELKTLIAACEPHRTFVALATNGYGYTFERLRELRNLGVDKLTISIDSWEPESHDKMRNRPGSHAEALKTLGLCIEAGIQPAISMLVTRGTTRTESFRRMAGFCVENHVQLVFSVATPLGGMEDDYGSLIDQSDRDAMEHLHAEYPWLTRDNYRNMGKVGCPSVKQWVQITEYGDVMPCAFCHIALGNIREESLASIRRRALRVPWFAEYQDHCLACENREFIEGYLSRNRTTTSYPVRAEDLFPEMAAAPRNHRNIRKVNVVCPVCGHTHFSPVAHGRDHEFDTTTDDEWTAVQCSRCRMVFLCPRPDDSEFDILYPPNYYCHRVRSTGAIQRWLTDLIGPSRAIRRLLRRSDLGGYLKVVDIGCGTGAALDVFRKEKGKGGVETVGVDADDGAARMARERGHEVYPVSFEHWDGVEGIFDVVYSSHVIEHVANPDSFMAKVGALLKPGGYFLCETPNYDGVDVRLFGSSWGGYHFPRHWHFFTLHHLNRLAQRYGLSAVEVHYNPSSFCWIFSLHALVFRITGSLPIADAIVPLQKDNLHAFILKGVATMVDAIALVLFGRTSMMSVTYRKKEK